MNRAIATCIGACITTYTDQTTKKDTQYLHVYFEKDFDDGIRTCKGTQTVELLVREKDIPFFKDQVFNLVGKHCKVTYDRDAYRKLCLYDIQENK